MSQIKIAVGSASQRKLQVIENVWQRLMPESGVSVRGFNVPSGQPDTPFDIQTFDGAVTRANNALLEMPDADFAVGLESGLVERYGHLFEEAWACIVADEATAYGYSSGLFVPTYVQERMSHTGRDHSDEMTIIEQEFGLLESETWGSYSGGQIIRAVSLEEACRNALLQLIPANNSLYQATFEATSTES